MNKKLLLSFAVFAATFGANAQKFARKAERQSNFVLNEVQANGTSRFDNVSSSKKRGPQTITDTLGFIGQKRVYGSPRTSGVFLTPYYEADSIELMSSMQTFKNNSKIMFKSIAASMVSLNPNGAKVDIKILDDKYTELAKVTKDVAYSTTGVGTYWFNLDKSVEIKGDFYISIEPNDVKDSVYLSTTGGYGRNTSATASIDGTTLTTTAFALTGSSFWNGQSISGAGIAAGTKIVQRTGQNTYTVSVSQTVASTTVLGKNITYGSLDGFLMSAKIPYVAGTKNPDFNKKPKFGSYVLHWDGANNKPFEADLFLFPVVEYVWDTQLSIDNKCLSTSKTVKLTYTNQDAFNIVKNPLLSKMAFWSKYLGYNKAKGYFYSRAYSSGVASLRDTLDDTDNDFSYSFTYTADDKNDTLKVMDLLIPYGYNKLASTKGFITPFLVSSILSANTTITPIDPKCSYDDAKFLLNFGGFSPYTGAPTFGQLAGNYTIKDANECTLTITTTGAIKASPAAIVPVATVTAAKCFGEKAKVEITATGGTGKLTIPAKEEVAAVAGEKSYGVVDENGCKVSVIAKIEAAPKAITLDSASVMASNDKKNDGKAIVIVTGGTIPYAYAWTTSVEKNDTIVVGKGKYSVVVTDANGCVAKASVTVAAGTASVEALAITNLSIYPNPVSSELNVSFDAKSAATVELVNIAGQVIASKVANEFVTSFNTASLESGVYFVNIKVAEGIYTQKIVKD